jgi:small multidrug resistance pump
VQWYFLSAAIVIELFASAGVKYTDGFTRPGLVVAVLAGYGVSFFLMSRAVREGLQVSVGYAIWSGVGTAALAVVGAIFLDEPLTWAKTVGIALVVAGVLFLTLVGEHR